MEIDLKDLGRRERYFLMTATLIPRPIAWVSTLSTTGNANLAPFSFFGGISSDPPMVMVSVGKRKGVRKDTAANLLANGEAVIHLPHRPLAEAMAATSADVAPDVDEFALAGLTKVAAVDVAPPRVQEAAIAMEAKVTQHFEIGAAPMDVFFLEVVRLHLDDRFVKDNLPDAGKLAVVGRLGGALYCDTATVFELPRPSRGSAPRATRE